MHTGLGQLIAPWLPLALIVTLWLFIRRGTQARTEQVLAMNDEIIALNREMVQRLKNIEKLLETGRTDVHFS